MLIGYARVSTQNQNLDRQLGALRAARCKQVFTEKATGRTVKGRPELEKAIDALGAGDVFVLAEWDRATRSMIDGITIMQFYPEIDYSSLGEREAYEALARAFETILSAHPEAWHMLQEVWLDHPKTWGGSK